MSAFSFDRSIQVAAEVETAWSLMTDVPRLVDWISVVGEAKEKEPLRTYTAVIQDRVGMFSLRADLDITLTNVRVHEHISAHAVGEDRQIGSRITIDAEIDLSGEGDVTVIRVQGSYGITGRAATLGASQIKRKGENVINDFFSNLEREASKS